MFHKHVFAGILMVAVTLLALMPTGVYAAPLSSSSAQAGNLLQNPGFEGLSRGGGWSRDTFNSVPYGEIYTPEGWVTWWQEGEYARPEAKVIPFAHPFTGPPARIRSGNWGLQLFTFWRNQKAGYYQTVTGLQPGATVQFSAYGQGWSCDRDDPPYSCGDLNNLVFYVGIDPNGGTDPWSPSIVWSGAPSPDQFRLIGPVTAQVGPQGSVTVFLRSITTWPVKHNDAYWDDASLTYVQPPNTPTSTPPPPPDTPTPGPSPTPRATPTPRPDGAIVHIVEEGDTLLGIALEYGVTLEQLRELNAGSIGPNDMIWPGQELVIALPSEAPTPTPPPVPPTAQPTAVVATSSICVLAYHDRDGDGTRDETTEELLPNATFSLYDSSGLVGTYTSDGVSEPYCFNGLAPGAYRVVQEPPVGYEPSSADEYGVALAAGSTWDLLFGNQRGGAAEATPGESTPAATPGVEEPDDGGSLLARLFPTVVRVSGILVLVLAAAVAVIFVLSRRRM